MATKVARGTTVFVGFFSFFLCCFFFVLFCFVFFSYKNSFTSLCLSSLRCINGYRRYTAGGRGGEGNHAMEYM